MASKKLGAYKGRLNASQIAEGMNAASQNASRLMEDADLLLQQGRFPTAASLAILSIEESGKATILRRLAVAADDVEVAICWREYRAHTKKNISWILPELVANGAQHLDDFLPIFDQNSDHPFILDQVKQIGFYTDCLGSGHWSVPASIVDETLASMLVFTAKILSKSKYTAPKEIELWIKHIGPVWRGSNIEMKQALVNLFAEMRQSGLISEDDDRMERFIYRDFPEK